jgi:hypothetical protein
MTDVQQELPRDGYICKGPPWVSHPFGESDATVFHAKQVDNAAPDM